jgi:hypothetical protein
MLYFGSSKSDICFGAPRYMYGWLADWLAGWLADWLAGV